MTNFEAVLRLQAMYPGATVVEHLGVFEVHGDRALGVGHTVVHVWDIDDQVDDSLRLVDRRVGRVRLPDWVVGR